MKIKRSIKSHIKISQKRYPSLSSKPTELLSKMAILDHILATNGTGYEFDKNGGIVNCYDDNTKKWEKDSKKKWEVDKIEWQKKYDKGLKKNEEFTDPDQKKGHLYIVKECYKSDKWYFDTFDPYVYRYKSLNDSPYIKKTTKIDVYELSKRSSPIYELPDNCKKDIVNASIELLDYMIETKQQLDKVIPLKKEISQRFLMKEIRNDVIDDILDED
jgi:hypothetical protein